MPTVDSRDDVPNSRRVAQRIRTRWQVALVFDRSAGKPIFQTLTHDLSIAGTAVQSDTDEKVHTVLTVLLRPPSRDDSAQRLVKLRAIVMSGRPFRGGFRLGLSFIHDAELDRLRALLCSPDLAHDAQDDNSKRAGPRQQHPLADAATARVLIDKLPSRDSMAVLRKISEWIAEIVQAPDFPLQRQVDVLDELDRYARAHQVSLGPAYLDTARMRKLFESQLWMTSFRFWQAIANGYLHCIERFQAGEGELPTFRRQLPLIVGRALRSLALQLKWSLARYAQVDETLWRDLGRAYLFAASSKLATLRSQIYSDDKEKSCVQDEFLKALIFYVSTPSALTPLQQQIAERVVAQFSSRFAVDAMPGPSFAFDLSMHVPPFRTRKDSSAAPLRIFFGPGPAAASLRELIDYVEQHAALPPASHVGSNFHIGDIRVVLDHLEHCWGETQAARRNKRQSVLTRMTVVPGLADTVQWLEDMIGDHGNKKADPPSAESWVVVDASHGGYGAVLSTQAGDWLKVGGLVGMRNEAASACQLGVLRRIDQRADSQQYVGVQLAGATALPVSLFAGGSTRRAETKDSRVPAILISRHPDRYNCIELIFSPAHFMYSKSLRMDMRYGERPLEIEYVRSVEQTKDFHWACYRLKKALLIASD